MSQVDFEVLANAFSLAEVVLSESVQLEQVLVSQEPDLILNINTSMGFIDSPYESPEVKRWISERDSWDAFTSIERASFSQKDVIHTCIMWDRIFSRDESMNPVGELRTLEKYKKVYQTKYAGQTSVAQTSKLIPFCSALPPKKTP